MTLNVAFYAPGWPAETAQNGIATYVESLAPGIEACGGKAFVIAPPAADLPESDSFAAAFHDDSNPLRTAWFKALWKLGRGEQAHYARQTRAIANAVMRLSEKNPIDILEIEESFGWARAIQKMIDIPVIVRIHGPHFIADKNESARGGPRQRARRIANEGAAIVNARGLSCPSKGLLEEVRNYYGGCGAVSRAIPNPIAVEDGAYRWRPETCDPNLLLFIGRFDHCKGADIAIQAFARAAAKRPNLRLVMAGSDHGVRAESGEILKFQDYADRFVPADLRARIEFLGRVPRERIRTLRRTALAHLSTSRHECFAYAVSESVAAGCPVIAAKTFGPPEVFAHDHALLCADIGDVDAFADHIERLAADPEMAASLAANGWAACRELLSPRKIAAQTLDFYGEARAAAAGKTMNKATGAGSETPQAAP
ncbi:MAG: glycosyltransferase family 4 protein [Parvularculaceae bacterium]